MNSSSFLSCVLVGNAAGVPAGLVLGTWTHVYAALDIRADQVHTQGALRVNATSAIGIMVNLTNTLSFYATDIVRIGGTPTFIGEVATLMIYSPGTLIQIGIHILPPLNLNLLSRNIMWRLSISTSWRNLSTDCFVVYYESHTAQWTMCQYMSGWYVSIEFSSNMWR